MGLNVYDIHSKATHGGLTSLYRCYRLDKPCVPTVTARQLNRASSATRSHAVEGQVSARDVNSAETSHDDPSQRTPSSHDNQDQDVLVDDHRRRALLPCPGEPSETQAEVYFASFRDEMLRFFPIFYLPPQMTSHQLRDEKPFLWLCIMCVACPSMAQQLLLGKSIREVVAREMVCDGEKSLDLLLGLLVFLAWAQYQIRYMTFVTHLSQLAISIIFDLGLNKAAEEPRGHISFRAATRCKPPSARPATPPRRPRTLEERRAVLGCYLLSSTFASTLRRMDGLKWTPEMDESLSLLSDQPAWPGDTALALQVKLQLLQLEAQSLGHSQGTWPFGNSVYNPSSNALNPSLLRGFEAKLRELERQFPASHAEQEVILCHFHSACLVVSEAFLNNSQPHSVHLPDLGRIDRHDACMSSIKAWFNAFFSIPASAYIGFTFPFMSQLAHSLLVLARFSTIFDPAWDQATVRNTVDILSICDKLTTNYDNVAKARSPTSGETKEADFFSDAASIFRFMRSEWQKSLNTTEHVVPEFNMEETQRLIDELLQPELTADWDEPPFLMDALWQ